MSDVPELEEEERLKPKITRAEVFWLAFFVLLVVGLIALAASDVWDKMFSVEEVPVESSD